MAAITHPRTHDLRELPTLRLVAPPARRRTTRVSPSTYRRRRLAVAVVVLGALLALRWVVGVLGSGPLAAPEPGLLETRPVAARVHVVQPGDTLWTVARSIEPRGDVREVVDALADAHGPGPLQVGERLVLPG